MGSASCVCYALRLKQNRIAQPLGHVYAIPSLREINVH